MIFNIIKLWHKEGSWWVLHSSREPDGTWNTCIGSAMDLCAHDMYRSELWQWLGEGMGDK